jgi:Xaa-Pro dipeptidase
VRYYTGFTGSNAALLVRADGTATVATDGRYQDQLAAEVPGVPAVITRSLVPGLVEASSLRAVAFQADHTTVAQFDEWRTLGPSFVRLGDAVRRQRMVKDDSEIALLRSACRVSDLALAALLPTVAVGRSERELARELDGLMLDLGADAVGFDTIVAAGENSAIPHHQPTSRPLASGDLLKVDFGALVGGYHADMTRTFVVDAAAEAWQQEAYLAVAAAQRAGRDAVSPGVEARAVDAAARAVLRDAGLEQYFTHGLGHGVGLQIHEPPFLGPAAVDRLTSGVALTVEPGVYLPGRGGVRIEDTLVVRHGSPELLTTTTRELLAVG